MKSKSLLICAVLTVLLLAPVAGVCYANGDIVEKIGANGSVDWVKGTIIVKGVGAPPDNAKNEAQARLMTERAAKVDAYRNAVEIVNGVRVSAESTVQNFTVTSDIVKTRIDGFVQGAQQVDIKYMSDGAIEIFLSIPIFGNGALADILLPAQTEIKTPSLAKTPDVCPTCGQPWPGKAAEISAPSKAAAAGEVYTGLVIDARGLEARPAITPRIVTEDGQEIYGSSYVSREFVIKQGMVGYSKDVAKAAQTDRVTDKPLVIKAIKISGSKKADFVVSAADAARLLAMKENLKFLEQCRVMVVVD